MKSKSLIKCSICKSKKFYKLYEYNKKPKNEKNFNISGKYKRLFYECKECKHIFSKHYFNIKKLYSKQYLDLTYKNKSGLNKRFRYIINLPRRLSDNKKRAERIDKFFLKKKKLALLDVGSGLGVFLYEMKKKGWITSGIEMDERYSDYCKKKHNLNVFKKNLSKLKVKKKFDLISFNKILEHVEQPQKLLKLAKKFLKRDGIIYVEVPDVRAKIGGKLRGEFCLDHLHVFSPQSLQKLVKKSSLNPIKITRIHEPSGKYTIFTFIKELT